MSTLKGLLGIVESAGGGTVPINGISQFANAPVLYTDLDGSKWLKSGNITTDVLSYPEALKSGFSIVDISLQYSYLLPTIADIEDFCLSGDGMKVFVCWSTNIAEFSTEIAGDYTNLTHVSTQAISGPQYGSFKGIDISRDGTALFINTTYNQLLYKFTLTTPNLLSSYVYSESVTITGSYGTLSFADNGQDFVMSGSNGLIIIGRFSEAWVITSTLTVLSLDNGSLGVTFPTGNYLSVFVSPNFDALFIVDNGATLYKFQILDGVIQDVEITYPLYNIVGAIIPRGVVFAPDGIDIYAVDSTRNFIKLNTLPVIGVSTPIDKYSYVRIK